jgi:hypothetical protein
MLDVMRSIDFVIPSEAVVAAAVASGGIPLLSFSAAVTAAATTLLE